MVEAITLTLSFLYRAAEGVKRRITEFVSADCRLINLGFLGSLGMLLRCCMVLKARHTEETRSKF